MVATRRALTLIVPTRRRGASSSRPAHSQTIGVAEPAAFDDAALTQIEGNNNLLPVAQQEAPTAEAATPANKACATQVDDSPAENDTVSGDPSAEKDMPMSGDPRAVVLDDLQAQLRMATHEFRAAAAASAEDRKERAKLTLQIGSLEAGLVRATSAIGRLAEMLESRPNAMPHASSVADQQLTDDQRKRSEDNRRAARARLGLAQDGSSDLPAQVPSFKLASHSPPTQPTGGPSEEAPPRHADTSRLGASKGAPPALSAPDVRARILANREEAERRRHARNAAVLATLPKETAEAFHALLESSNEGGVVTKEGDSPPCRPAPLQAMVHDLPSNTECQKPFKMPRLLGTPC